MESHGQDPRLFTSKKDNSVHIILLTKHDTAGTAEGEGLVGPRPHHFFAPPPPLFENQIL